MKIENTLHLFLHFFKDFQVFLHGTSIGQGAGQIVVVIGEIGVEHGTEPLENVLLHGFLPVFVQHEIHLGKYIDNPDGIQFPPPFGIQVEFREVVDRFVFGSGDTFLSELHLRSVRQCD